MDNRRGGRACKILRGVVLLAWAKGAEPIPPGPGNPLGKNWMGLSVPEVGIEGTPDAASVGYSRSHGCARMYRRQAEWPFRRVRVGTPVIIVPVERCK
jgi:lipoprotein-anchoring transpeptidase ErfK/SrfK